MVATPLPGEAQARPEDFRDVEKRQQAVVFQHLVRRVQVHQVQFVGGLDQLLLGAFGNGEVLAGIFVDHMAVGADICLLQRVIFVKPFSVELTFVFQPRAADFQQFAVDFRLGNAVFRVVGLDHPAEDLRVVEGVMDGITPVLHAQTQLARPLLPERQRGVNHVLLRNTHPIVEKLGDHRHVAGLVKLTALLPDQQRPGARRAFRTVGKGLKGQNVIVHHLTQKAQGEDFPRHADVGKHKAIVEEQETAGKLNALPLVAHVFVADIAAEICVFRVFSRVQTAVI